MTILVRAEFRVRPENLQRFTRAARAVAAAAATEAATLRYDWYETDDPNIFVVLEEYTDPEAAFAHNQHCARLIRDVGEVTEMTAVQLHGDLGPDLAAWVAERPHARAHTPLRP